MWNLDYKEVYQLSLDYPEKYWDEVAKDVVWSKPYTSVLEDKDSTSPRWYVGGEINMSYNCLDRQVEDGYGDDIAVIHDSPRTETIQRYTYKELLRSVELLSGVMSVRCNIVKGDRVLLSFPMIPQCLIAMLACTRIGAIYTTVFGGFAVKELAARIQYFEPKLIISTNVGLEPGQVIHYKDKMDTALSLCEFVPDYCIIYNRPNYLPAVLKEGRDLDWHSEMLCATPRGVTPVESEHPHYVIFTSGTAGEPKGIVRQTGGSVVQNKYCIKRMTGLQPGEIWWVMSDFSWIMGQTILTYGPLMTRNPTIIFEGKLAGLPDCAQIMRVVNQHNVVSFVSIPTVMRILRKSCSKSDLVLTQSNLRAIHLGGEMMDASLSEWTSQTFQCPVYNIWSQTELGDAGISPCLGILGSEKYLHDRNIGLMMPGFRCKIVHRDTGKEVPDGTIGRIVFKMPLTPSAVSTLYKDHNRYIQTYLSKYPGYFDTMDAGMIRNDGLLKLVARDDDIIHVGAVRICGGAVEEACLKNECIVDAIVVALEDDSKGFVPFAFLIPKDNSSQSDSEIIEDTIDFVRQYLGDVASFNKAVIVPDFPRNIAGKTPRKSLKDMLNGKVLKIPSTVSNPGIYSTIYEILIMAGYKASLPTDV